MGEDRETLTIRQAAALLGVHPNTVRNRTKGGVYEAEKAITERGETYMISRSELERAEADKSTTNTVPSASHSQPLPGVREVMQTVLEPFVGELGNVREELSRERERREQAERRVEERQLSAPPDEQNQAEDTESRSDRGYTRGAGEGHRTSAAWAVAEDLRRIIGRIT